MVTINEELIDLILKRSHYIYLFENGMIQDMIDPYNRAKTELMTRVARLEDYGQGWTLQYRMDRLNSQLHEMDMILKNANDDGIATVSNYLNEFGQVENDFYNRLLGDRFGTIGINTVGLPIQQIYEIVNTPIGGSMYHERMVKRYGDAMFNIKSDLTQSVLQGEDMAKASRRLFGIGQAMGGEIGSRLIQQSSVIARTEIMRVSNAVSQRIYDENTDILKGVQWISTLDNRTCLICGALDGKIFYYNKKMVPPPRPRHPRCRCCLVPITKSWAELGADQKIQEPDAGTRPFTYIGEKPPLGSRQYVSQMNKWAGDVPATEIYPQWLKRMNGQDPAFVRDILGPKRYELWQAGKLEFNDMVKGNKILTLDKLGGKIGGVSPIPVKSPLKTGTVVSVSPLGGGINQTEIIEISINNTEKVKAVFKSVSGEVWINKGGINIRNTIINQKFSLANREVAAYEVDQALGFNLVPQTTLRRVISETGEVRLGSVQKWAEGDLKPFYNFDGNLDPKDSYKIGILDFLIGNTDRHGYNLLVNLNNKKPICIDHGFSFPRATGTIGSGLLGLEEFYCQPLIKFYREQSEFEKIFSLYFDETERKKIVTLLNNLNIEGMAKKYKMNSLEKAAFLKRRGELVEAIETYTLDDLFKRRI
jgi:SPP1 gp7 family putative phage head morphogenesis protein